MSFIKSIAETCIVQCKPDKKSLRSKKRKQAQNCTDSDCDSDNDEDCDSDNENGNEDDYSSTRSYKSKSKSNKSNNGNNNEKPIISKSKKMMVKGLVGEATSNQPAWVRKVAQSITKFALSNSVLKTVSDIKDNMRNNKNEST